MYEELKELMSPRRVQQFLRVHTLFAKKSLGQNFLVNRDVLEKITASARLSHGDVVVEIGSGLGFLTCFLLEAGARVIAFEKDTTFMQHLEAVFADAIESGMLVLHNEDVLKTPLAERLSGIDSFSIVSNLPYNITSPVFGRFLPLPGLRQTVVTVQREVAERIASKSGVKAYGSLTVFCRFYTDPELLFHISPGNFHPAPSVYSSVVRLSNRKAPLEGDEGRTFFNLVRFVFSSRRKTLRNSLRQMGLSDEVINEKVLPEAGLDGGMRGEQLDLDGFAGLARVIEKHYPDAALRA